MASATPVPTALSLSVSCSPDFISIFFTKIVNSNETCEARGPDKVQQYRTCMFEVIKLRSTSLALCDEYKNKRSICIIDFECISGQVFLVPPNFSDLLLAHSMARANLNKTKKQDQNYHSTKARFGQPWGSLLLKSLLLDQNLLCKSNSKCECCEARFTS